MKLLLLPYNFRFFRHSKLSLFWISSVLSKESKHIQANKQENQFKNKKKTPSYHVLYFFIKYFLVRYTSGFDFKNFQESSKRQEQSLKNKSWVFSLETLMRGEIKKMSLFHKQKKIVHQ